MDNNDRFRQEDLDFIVTSDEDTDEFEHDVECLEQAALQWALTGHCPTQREIEAAIEDLEADPDWDIPSDDSGADPRVMDWNQYLLDDADEVEQRRQRKIRKLQEQRQDLQSEIEELQGLIKYIDRQIESVEEGEWD